MNSKVTLLTILMMIFLSTSCSGNREEMSEKKEIVYFSPCFWGNGIFNPEVKNVGCYELGPFYKLHQVAEKRGYDLRVCDINYGIVRDLSVQEPTPVHEFDAVVVFEVADFQLHILSQYPKEKLNLILWEPPTTMPVNYYPENHQIFSRVYTWHDGLVDNKKYFKVFYPVLRPMKDNPFAFEERKLCTLVAANKNSWVENELYSERRNVIDFFESHHPGDFDFYGWGWPEDTYATYKGMIDGNLDDKIEKLKEYKFVFAYENGKEIPGYITEKIFDCFAAGTVPIYWGAPNVESYIPKNCFINREDFKDSEELYAFLTAMTKEQYMDYIHHIRNYLDSEQAQLFSEDHFVETMMTLITQNEKKLGD